MPIQIKISSPLNQVAEIKQAIREARRADQLAENAAIRVFHVFRELKFGNPVGPAPAIDRLDKAHDLVGDARSALGETIYQLEKLLSRAGYTLPAKD